jgi:translation elongation factor EF-G
MGVGVDSLIARITELLPAAEGDVDGPVSGTVFKVERGPAGEKIAYVRMFSGTLRTRDRLQFGQDNERKVTAISVFDRGSAVQRASVAAGRTGTSGVWTKSGSATLSAYRERSRSATISLRRLWKRSSFLAVPSTKARYTLRSPSSPSRIR